MKAKAKPMKKAAMNAMAPAMKKAAGKRPFIKSNNKDAPKVTTSDRKGPKF